MPVHVASGGASGGYARKLFTGLTGGSTVTYAIGAAGAAGAAGNNDGGNGGDSTLTAGGSTVTGKGGSGADTRTLAVGFAVGPSGGTSTGGDVNGEGRPGAPAINLDADTVGLSGTGGTPCGGVGVGGQARDSVGDGLDGTGRAAGGGGAFAGATTDRAGGAGTAGIIIVREYT